MRKATAKAKGMGGVDNKMIGQALNGAIATAKIDIGVAAHAFKHFLNEFGEKPNGPKDRRRFIKEYTYTMGEDGQFDAPEPVLALLRDIDRPESPFSESCEKVTLHVGLYMRAAKTELPEAGPGVAARWVVNLGQPDTLRMVGGTHSYRVFFGTNDFRFLGAIQEANYSVDSAGGTRICVPTLHTMLQDGFRKDKQKLKLRNYTRITILVDAHGDTEIQDEELRTMLKKTVKVRDNAFSGKQSDVDLKEAAIIAKKAGERFAQETGAEEDPERKELLENMREAFSGIDEASEEKAPDAPTPSSGEQKEHDSPTPSSDQETEAGVPTLSSDEEKALGAPTLSSGEQKEAGVPTLSSDEEKAPGPPTLSSGEQKEAGVPTLSSDEEKALDAPTLSSGEQKVPAAPTLSSGEQKAPAAPTLSSGEQKEAGVPTLSSDQETEDDAPTVSSGEQKAPDAPTLSSGEEKVPAAPTVSLGED